jgi:23S rRNA pseudouridine1911/1915/1917 synthase
MPDPEFLYKKAFLCESSAEPRLDAFLAKRAAGISRSYLKDLIQAGLVTVNGDGAKPSTRLRPEDRVVLLVPQPKDASAQAEDIPLNIRFQDEHLLVVVKPRGMLTHPAPGKYQGTLVNALLHHCKDLSGIHGELRPGIVHRLDRDTSGLMVVAKNDDSHRALQDLFRDRALRKRYLALCSGRLAQKDGLIDIPIGRHRQKRFQMAAIATGKRAQSEFHTIRTYGDTALVAIKILTGRTHQIRVHMSHIGYPVVGDIMYGNRRDNRFPAGFALHAWNLEFQHPITGEQLRFYEPLPQDMRDLIRRYLKEEREGFL